MTAFPSALALALLVAVVALLLLGSAYGMLRNEAVGLRAHARTLYGLGAVVVDVTNEMGAFWKARVASGQDAETLTALGKLVSQSIQPLFLAFGGSISDSKGTFQFQAKDFAAAGLADQFTKITALVGSLEHEDLTKLWKTRRLVDLMAMLRVAQSLMDKSNQADLAAVPSPSSHNSLLVLLRDKADSLTICDDIENQMFQLEQATGSVNESPERTSAALRAVVDVLCFRRDRQAQVFSLGALVHALTGRNIERMYRECLADAESSAGGWRPEYQALRDYVDNLPAWDGRLPFHDVTMATHGSIAGVIMRTLTRIV